ncbi:UvrD-helicase domain-containing protein [candidate division WWE3 bacterium]|uniref:DNA 3'-5' helicase n=1 Tax=candidate division WWE3 bacterium TaxID=2053526 RepID=A0A955LVX5_UNCKA|nr:UvrD-helicase domain-containing protein [candidate division WWE3 bacterium]
MPNISDVNPDELLINLNLDQQAAVAHTTGPALVLAGAGSGKTRVLTHRIAYLILTGVAPENILAVTFTNKAASEMKDRVKELLEDMNIKTEKSLPTLGTFHSVCARILRRHIEKLGYSREFVIYDTNDQVSLIKKFLKDFNIDEKKITPKGILGAISSAKSELMSPAQYESHARGPFQETAAKIYPRYQKALKSSNALDFDDLLYLTVTLLQENPEIQQHYQEQYQYVMIDEYQDTNHSQYMITRLIAKDHGNIFVVGDMSQAIYSWRGANIRNILQFKHDYENATIYNLEQNYRSTQTILDAATAVIKPNQSAHPILHLWTENNEGEEITVYESDNESEEAFYIVQEIDRMIRDGYDYSDFCVLYRTNAQSRALEELFIREGLPYQLIGNVKFYDRREVKDILSYLRLVYNPADSVSYERVVNTPPRGIGPVTLEKGGPKVDAFHEMMDNFRAFAQTNSVYELIDHILQTIDYETYLDDGTDEGIARWENVKELRSVAAEYAHLEPADSIREFLENVALVEQTDMSTANDEINVHRALGNVVTLMTLHAAKGLEFPVVFIIGMEEGIFPHSRSMMDQGELEEERRLCYVGITRAKQKLYMSFARQRLYFGERLPNPPSRFLNDLPKKTVIFKQSPTLSRFDSRYSGRMHAYGENIDDDEIIF